MGTTRVNFRLPDELVEKADVAAQVTHRNRTEVVSDALREYLADIERDEQFDESVIDLDLDVDYQPTFGSVGRSTPEFIVSRLVANSDDGRERAGYMALAEAVGSDAIQRTLADASWSG